jgi:hypothetical protein
MVTGATRVRGRVGVGSGAGADPGASGTKYSKPGFSRHTLGMLHYVQHYCPESAVSGFFVAFHATLLAVLGLIGVIRLRMLYKIQH